MCFCFFSKNNILIFLSGIYESLLSHLSVCLSLSPLLRATDFLWPLHAQTVVNSLAIKAWDDRGTGAAALLLSSINVLISTSETPVFPHWQLTPYNSYISSVYLPKTIWHQFYFSHYSPSNLQFFCLCPILILFCTVSNTTVLFMCFINKNGNFWLFFSASLLGF